MKQSSKNILLLLGEPGQGKSSICKKIVSDSVSISDSDLDFVSNHSEEKFFIDREIFYFSLSPSKWIESIVNIKAIGNIFTIPKNALAEEKYFAEEKILLDVEYLKDSLILLDGFDEAYLNLEEKKITITNFFEKLVKFSKNWNSKFIVTSRNIFSVDLLYNLYNGTYENNSNIKKNKNNDIIEENKTQICRLCYLTRKQQRDWVNFKYNKMFPQKKYNIEKMYNLHKKNNKQSTVLDLLKIPILLQLIISENFYDDARNTVDLYDKLFIKILDTRKETTKNNKENFKKIFESFAYNIYKNNDQYTFIKNKKLETNESKKVVSLFYMKSMKSNQLNKYYIEFIHRTFYQYFQAWYFYHLILSIEKEIHKIGLEKVNQLDYISVILEDKDKITNLFSTGFKMKNKVTILCKSISWRKMEKDVIDMMGQISQNQIDIREKNQISYILDIFERTDGIIKNEENNEWCIPIGQSNVLNIIEIMVYNLLMILNIILPNGLILLESSKIEYWIRCFDMTGIYLPNIILSGLNLNRVNLSKANLIGANLENADLTGANLTNANLQGTNLKEVYLERADLTEANLENADLTGAYLERTHLERTHLERTYLMKADLTRAYLKGTYLNEAHLEGAHLEGTNLEGAHLEGAHLEGADLEGAYLEGTNLTNANLERTNLQGVHLGKTCLEKTCLEWADLTRIDLTKSNLTDISLKRANLEEAHLEGVDLEGINLEGADLPKAYLTDAHLENAILEGADLSWAHLVDAHLIDTNLKEANLKYTDLRCVQLLGANLIDADLSWADLSWADLIRATLKGANLKEAYLEGANLTDANLERTNLIDANLNRTDLTNANLTKATLIKATLTETNLTGADLTDTDLRKAIFDPIILTDAILENTKISKERYDEIVDLGIDVNKIIWCNSKQTKQK